jgi:hypothetical protein
MYHISQDDDSLFENHFWKKNKLKSKAFSDLKSWKNYNIFAVIFFFLPHLNRVILTYFHFYNTLQVHNSKTHYSLAASG